MKHELGNIHLISIEVVNVRAVQLDERIALQGTLPIYVGRGRAPRYWWQPVALGNPHPIGFCRLCGLDHRRGEAIQHYQPSKPKVQQLAAFLQRYGEGFELEEGEPPREFRLLLGCWCAPLPCHGDILAETIDDYLGR